MQFTSLDEWLAWLEQLHPSEIDLGLERIRQVADPLGVQPNKAKVITVAGTNGKGSTLAFLESILLAAGYRVGKYTSPHLYRFNERICIDGQPVDDALICAALSEVESRRGQVSLTYFEFTTLAALKIFQQTELDVWLLEVGLGGRLDAVNIIDPDCAIITSIGLDHTDWLGDTREAIGFEKAGILRTGIPAVFGNPDMPDSVQAQAEKLQVTLLQAGRDYHMQTEKDHWTLQLQDTIKYRLPLPRMSGAFQLENAASAIVALQQLPELKIPTTALEQGLQTATLTGRFQRIPGTIEYCFDVAHNPQGAEALATQLASLPSAGKTLAIFSALRDKDVAGMVRPLTAIVDDWYLAGSQVGRGQSAQDIAAKFDDWRPQTYHDARAAWQAARQAAKQDDRILVYGSFYLVGDLLQEVEHGRPD